MKKSVACTLMAVSTLVCSGCQSPGRLPMEKNTSLPFALQQEQRDILYYASLAPNAHNSQPWRIRYHKDTQLFTLIFDTRRALPQTDPTHRESYISLGAFLENLRQAANALGFSTDIEITAKPALSSSPDEVAQIQILPQPSPAEHKPKAILTRIEQRHTDKRPYASTPISAELIQDLLKKHAPYLTYYAAGSDGFRYISSTAIRAMQTQADDQGKRDELALWLRFSNKEASATRDGLPAEQLGITGIRKFFYYLFCDREMARGDAFAKESVSQVEEQVTHCAGFFALSGDDTAPDYIRTGMNLEAFWLDAVAAGISLQPLSQILEEEPYKNHVMGELGLPLPPQMILRAGILDDYGTNHKIRRNIEDFVHNAE